MRALTRDHLRFIIFRLPRLACVSVISTCTGTDTSKIITLPDIWASARILTYNNVQAL